MGRSFHVMSALAEMHENYLVERTLPDCRTPERKDDWEGARAINKVIEGTD